MATKTINLRLVAYSDAAGKFDADAPLNGNEDNFYVDDDITDEVSGLARLDTPVPLSDKGCVMAVADGMGGQNAGEVASEIAVSTIAEFFSADRITPEILRDADSRAEYIRRVITEADSRVKAGAEGHPERFGMGSTIIISWIVDGILTVGWLGDSRCYRFNPRYGLVPVSRDHTYVQELADNGILTYQDTFSHPQGNIVTRSLGDPESTPQPETASSQLYDGDVILMCSDGLSGVVPDRPMRDIADSINGIMTADYADLTAMKDHLMEAAERQDWYDNVTVLLAKFTGDLPAAPSAKQMAAADPTGGLRALFDEPATVINPPAPAEPAPKAAGKPAAAKSRTGRYIGIALVVLLIAAAVFFALKIFNGGDDANKFTASEGETPVRPVETYDGDDSRVAVPDPQVPSGPDGTPVTSADGKNVAATNASQTPVDVEIEPVDDPAGNKAATQTSMAGRATDGKWNALLDILQTVHEIKPWQPRVKTLEDEINKAAAESKDGRYEALSAKVNRLVALKPLALEILANIPNLNKNKQKAATTFISKMPDMKDAAIEERKVQFLPVPDPNK